MVPLSRETLRRLDVLFAPGDRNAAAALLSERCADNLPFFDNATPNSLERVPFAALKLSSGDLAKLKQAVDLAETDWRDVLVAAGFGDDLRAHLNWVPKR